MGYDASHLLKSAGLSGEVTYTRDTVTKGLASIKLGGMTQAFSYDGFGRLAGEAQDSATATYGPGSESYAYDAAGNRNQAGYSYTTTNAVRGRPSIGGDTLAPGDSLVYDAAGNPTWWKNQTTNWYDVLTWDAEDRLIRLERYNQSSQPQLDVNYAYDGFGRRVKKWGTGVTTTLYVWNGWEVLAETDGSGTATRRYTHAPEGVDFPLAMPESGTTSLFHLDGQGNVYLLTNTAGTRRSEYRYRAYGDRYVTPVGEAVQSPFGYKAREEDRETGLIYMRHRYYSPRLERFLNQDPIGIGGGLNLYAFAGSNPANGRDPLGLDPGCDWSTDPPRCELETISVFWISQDRPPRWVEEYYFSLMMKSMNAYSGWGSTNRGLLDFGDSGGRGNGAHWGPRGGSNSQGEGAQPNACHVAWAAVGWAAAQDFLTFTGFAAAAVPVGGATRAAALGWAGLSADLTMGTVAGAWGVQPLASGGILAAGEFIGGFAPGINFGMSVLRAVKTCP